MPHPVDEPPVVSVVRSDSAVMPRFHRVLAKYELSWRLLNDTPVLTEWKDTVTGALRRAFLEVTSKAAARHQHPYLFYDWNRPYRRLLLSIRPHPFPVCIIPFVTTPSWCVRLLGFALLASAFSPHMIDWIMAAVVFAWMEEPLSLGQRTVSISCLSALTCPPHSSTVGPPYSMPLLWTFVYIRVLPAVDKLNYTCWWETSGYPAPPSSDSSSFTSGISSTSTPASGHPRSLSTSRLVVSTSAALDFVTVPCLL